MEPDQSTQSYPPGQGGPPPSPPSDPPEQKTEPPAPPSYPPQQKPEPTPGDGELNCAGELNRDQILRDLKGKLQESQTEADRLKKLADKLQTDVEALQKSSQDIDSVVDGYRQDYRRIRSELANLRCWYDRKYAELSDTVPAADRKAVEDKRKEVDDYIRQLENTVNTLASHGLLRLEGGSTESLQYAEIQVTNAATGPGGVDDKTKAYEALKNFHKQVVDDLKKLDGWKKEIEDAVTKEKLRLAWFLLLDFGDLLRDLEKRVDKYTPDYLRKELDRAWCELVNARQKLRDAEAARNARAFALESKRKALEEARKTRRERILDAISRG